ncbi:hypothetical protein ACFO9E_33165 [Streptomyces maoxianensis]|uniref:Uncharacterized protein n=1 Tax=Streptomyces maoxianensis TaxID=1459942 RepID=A0ABV9GHF3_9ACTN
MRILKGTVHTAREAELRLSDERFGHTHFCGAYPITDVDLDV